MGPRETGVPHTPSEKGASRRSSIGSEIGKRQEASKQYGLGGAEAAFKAAIERARNREAERPIEVRAFGEALKDLMALLEGAGLKRPEQARLLGMVKSTLLRRLSGETVPDDDELERMISVVAAKIRKPIDTALIERIWATHAEASEAKRPGMRLFGQKLIEFDAEQEAILSDLEDARRQLKHQQQVIDGLVRVLVDSSDAERREKDLRRQLAQAIRELDSAVERERTCVEALRASARRLTQAAQAYMNHVMERT